MIRCKIETTLGDIEVELYPEKAPTTVANFLNYTDAGLYTNSSFFRACTPANEADRAIQIEVIQGGNVPEEKEMEPIQIETTKQTGLLHQHGTLSMARDKPNSATCSFFICLGDQPSLDFGGARNPDGFGFAAFGRVTQGMEVVLEIQKQKEEGQYFIEPVPILRIVRINE
ncbi:peptidylprolyl isomerase [Reichenbachiella faecimaris]|uniref:peptidylprolyl isomerase n=1 Tax=Reichenbachiella faecimaris TaxID=692418 RepID=UPI001FE3F5BB|nr:peptidylprolyl isomerase [Reichenbachiella faecimaris]